MLSAAASAISAEVNFTVVNNAADTIGGKRFERRIGADYSCQAMSTATNFIWDLLEQTTTTTNTTTSERRDYSNVTLYIEPMDGADGVSAYALGNSLHISANYIGNYTGNVKKEFTGVLYHVLAYTWTWDGEGEAPRGLRSGMAEFVRLKAHYAPRMVGGSPGRTDYWDEGYGVTAMFLDYCNNIKDGFVAQLNANLKEGYSRGYFRELLGKSVDVLWQDYKSKYQMDRP
ncbi:unnamed protein product [Linum tenue]|uniref:Uncharacterized protein n=3 Tax=Linum tenue TaxID=586396 RepID=A0AAV0KZA0_9ROSI|nr:unnamed protein product [Linum tenue]